jgi:hypothetical protein
MRPMAKALTNGCARHRRIQLRMHGVASRRRKQAACRYGGRRPESRLRHPFTGMAEVRLWPVGLLRRRSRKAAGSELLAGTQVLVGRVVGRKIGGVSRVCSATTRATSSRRMVPFEGARRRPWDVRGRRNLVVKALSAATTRGGSAWQTSKDVLPTGARARKKSTGSVDGVGGNADSRGSRARITGRRTKAGAGNSLADPPRPS